MVALQILREDQLASETGRCFLADIANERALPGIGLIARTEVGKHQVRYTRRLGKARDGGGAAVAVTLAGAINQ
ncbi:hypothetical protein D3C84_1099640 [compost metagenome]